MTRISGRGVPFYVLHRITHLHRAGVGAQQVAAAIGRGGVHVERVVHRTRGVVGRRVQGGEVEPVFFDLRAFGNVKTHGAEDGLDPLHRARHRVQAARAAQAPRQGYVQGLGPELDFQLSVGQGLAARGQGSLDALLGLVDLRAASLFLFGGQRRQTLQQVGHLTGLAQVAGFGIFQLGRRGSGGKFSLRSAHQLIEIVHVSC